MARPGIGSSSLALRRARSESLARDPLVESLMGDFSESMENLEVLLYEVLDGRPIWNLATRPAGTMVAESRRENQGTKAILAKCL
jgi:hypothetical protein